MKPPAGWGVAPTVIEIIANDWFGLSVGLGVTPGGERIVYIRFRHVMVGIVRVLSGRLGRTIVLTLKGAILETVVN